MSEIIRFRYAILAIIIVLCVAIGFNILLGRGLCL